MLVQKTLALRGPHIWFAAPALEIWVELTSDFPTCDPNLADWVCRHLSSDRNGITLMEQPASRLEVTLLALLRAAGADVSRSLTAQTSIHNVFRVVVEYEDEQVAKQALTLALDLIARDPAPSLADLDTEARALAAFHQQWTLGPSTRSIVAAARRRGIPFRRLTSGSMLQFGYGARQRRIQAAETDQTGAIAQEIAQDKELTRTLLRAVGVPVPDGESVDTAQEAWAVAQEIGLPVVVKPRDGNQGRGVATNLHTEAQVLAAFEAAHQESSTGRVIVETFAPGDDYRVLVIGDRVVAASRREPAQVTGDGIHTIAQLVERVNQDPRRGEDHATALSKIPLDAVSIGVLTSQSYTPESVPENGTRVLIRRNANLSTGGTACDVTDRVHPAVAERCIEAARMIGLDIAGVDVVALDLSRPLEDQGGVVVEVNAAPGLRMHLEPSEGQPRAVGEAIVDLLYPFGANARIPIAAVTGVNGKTTVTRFLSYVVQESGKTVGMTCTDGVYVNDRRIATGDCSGPASARAVLMNPAVEAAILETARGGIVRAGLGFDACDVAIVTNIAEGDHLGISDIHTLADLARVKRTIVENVTANGAAVLNAADPLVAEMAQFCPGSVIYFAIDPDEPVLAAHRTRGGRAVFVRHGEIVFAEGARETGISRLSNIPLTHRGLITFQVENTLAVVGGAFALGIDADCIRQGLETFGAETDTLPGRFNLFEIHGATVIVDYGHNTSALQAMIDAIESIPCRSRSIVYSAAGDRRDCDMTQQGALLAQHFDSVVLYEDQYRRGRANGEIMRIFREGLANGTRVRRIDEHHGAFRAIAAALDSVQPQDLLVIQADEIDGTVEFIRKYVDALASGRELGALDDVEALALAPALPFVSADVD